MDAIIVAQTIEMGFSMVDAEVTTVICVDDLVLALESLFAVSPILNSLRKTGNSLTAVAPDHILIKGGKSALAYA